VKIGSEALAVESAFKEPTEKKKKKKGRVSLMRNFVHTGKETAYGIMTKFCLWVDIEDLITYATFGDDRLRGLGVATWQGVEFLVTPLTCAVVDLKTLSHYHASV